MKMIPVEKALNVIAATTVMKVSSGVDARGMPPTIWAANRAEIDAVTVCGEAIIPGAELSKAITVANTMPLNSAIPMPVERFRESEPEKINTP